METAKSFGKFLIKFWLAGVALGILTAIVAGISPSAGAFIANPAGSLGLRK